MVQIDVPIAFGIGSFFADAAHRQLQEGKPENYYRAFWMNNIFQIFFFSWIPVYFLMNYFGWETTHMWWHADSIMAYPFYMPVFLVVFFGAANLGFYLGSQLVRAGRELANRIVYLGIVAYSGVWVFAQTHNTFYLGTYSEWAAGQAPIFYQDRTFLTMFLISMVVWSIGLAVFGWILYREGRHVDPVLRARRASIAGAA
jgi:hypothetical protein